MKNPKQNQAIAVLRIFFAAILMSPLAVATSDAKPRPTPTPAPMGKTARLIVQRAPNFGSDLFIRLLVDGKRVANIPRNQHYGGFVSAGRHTVTALALPNTEARRPTSFLLNAKAGQVYIFTATWDSDRLVLAPSTYYMPTTRVNKK
ncbi:MAG TPA: hypothetical protein VLK27_00180 [Chthoniobacterales bacterium]|nr:hypothetical protein [Chthoniobacterales bacterium]